MSTKRKILIGLLVLFAVVVIAGGGYALYYVGYRVGSLSTANFGERIQSIFPFHRGFPPSRMQKRTFGHFGHRGWYDKYCSIIDKEEILADALGISIEELQTSCEEGKTLYKLIDELDLEVAKVLESLDEGFKKAIEKAVKDNVITQEQADKILNGKWYGIGSPLSFCVPMGFGGKGGFLGRGGFRGSCCFRSKHGFGCFGKFQRHK